MVHNYQDPKCIETDVRDYFSKFRLKETPCNTEIIKHGVSCVIGTFCRGSCRCHIADVTINQTLLFQFAHLILPKENT